MSTENSPGVPAVDCELTVKDRLAAFAYNWEREGPHHRHWFWGIVLPLMWALGGFTAALGELPGVGVGAYVLAAAAGLFIITTPSVKRRVAENGAIHRFGRADQAGASKRLRLSVSPKGVTLTYETLEVTTYWTPKHTIVVSDEYVFIGRGDSVIAIPARAFANEAEREQFVAAATSYLEAATGRKVERRPGSDDVWPRTLFRSKEAARPPDSRDPRP